MLVTKLLFVIGACVYGCESVRPNPELGPRRHTPKRGGSRRVTPEREHKGSCKKVPNSDLFHKKTSCNEDKQLDSANFNEGQTCRLLCVAGYIENVNEMHPVCKKMNSKKQIYKWDPEPKCPAQNCGTNRHPGFPVSSFVNDKIGRIVVYYVKYDRQNKLPMYSAALHDKLTYTGKKVLRTGSEKYWSHPCQDLEKLQLDNWGEVNEPKEWQHGHLTPFYAMSGLGLMAANSTFMYVNIAWQASTINMGPWNYVESWVFETLAAKNYPALVITGLCRGGNGNAKPPKPAPCFWKLVCFKEVGKPTVVGFVSQNKVFVSAAEKIQRKVQATQFRTQKEVLSLISMGDNEVRSVWKESRDGVYRENVDIPTSEECYSAMESDLKVYRDL